jgi:hypothetical protein
LRPLDELPSPSGRVVKLEELHDLMPGDHPRVERAARRKQLCARRAWFARRFQA